jgi:hypothetical protein
MAHSTPRHILSSISLPFHPTQHKAAHWKDHLQIPEFRRERYLSMLERLKLPRCARSCRAEVWPSPCSLILHLTSTHEQCCSPQRELSLLVWTNTLWGTVVQTCTPSTGEAEAGGSPVKPSSGYMVRSYLKKKKAKQDNNNKKKHKTQGHHDLGPQRMPQRKEKQWLWGFCSK